MMADPNAEQSTAVIHIPSPQNEPPVEATSPQSRVYERPPSTTSVLLYAPFLYYLKLLLSLSLMLNGMFCKDQHCLILN